MRRILVCVGTRPNFVKVVGLREIFESEGYEYKILHTGQHYDYSMSEVFFKQLSLGEPDYYLGAGKGSNNEIVGKIITEAEPIMKSYRPDMVIVPGDVNSTFACAFTAASLRIPVAHIEAGLRSFDMDMPEERNRILTDNISDLLFVTEQDGVDNLLQSGFKAERIKLVGNTIVDALVKMQPHVNACTIQQNLQLAGPYCVVTFHRPVNVDVSENLAAIVNTLTDVAKTLKVVFPVHPRTRKNMEQQGLLQELTNARVLVVEPLGYVEFLKLITGSSFVLSDSGGVQIETSYFNIPCFTVRDTAELQITINRGTNTLIALDKQTILGCMADVLSGKRKTAQPQPVWDGNASKRIAEEVKKFLA